MNAYVGRNIESFGVDAYLNGITFGIAVHAIVDAGVVPGGKVGLVSFLSYKVSERTVYLMRLA